MLNVLKVLKMKTSELEEQVIEVKKKADNLSKLVDSVIETLDDTDLDCRHVEEIDNKLNEKLKNEWDLAS